MRFDPAFIAALPQDFRFILVGVGFLLLPHLVAGLFWSAILRLKLAVPAGIVGLVAAQGAAVTMTSRFGWFGGTTGMGRIALCLLLWLILTLVILNILAAIVTRLAPPLQVDGDLIPPAPFWPTGLLDWVLRQEEAVKSATYVPPSSLPPREGFD
ncbi:hypothetical protein [Sphingomonas carotinifaciens]|uniref:Uncharacterized protein n=1 Tax=Sphingomonas carotinifaciens TaxID=1166323 RepID=A0A1G7PU49_9SPHN|nr:hypothetical protein [Sphingomonas carotinifaciens]MBB4087504.1 hypothetical protein [Sphingomonas carotinifaciens]MWC45591.1 hypothetical protein [Sphingomonas carotinifaciens]SDF89764.1 hypothetical protein SAMN05216557_10779 [Sphingomonas carotinifaciens]